MVSREYDPRRWLSVSRLKSVSKCGERYRLERVEKIPSRPAAWTPRGIAAHETIEQYEKTGRQINPEEFYLDEAWPKALAETLKKFPDQKNWMKTPRVGSVKKDIELRQADGLKQVLTYVDRAVEEQDLWRVLEAEVDFKIEYPDFFILGYIDQVREWIPTGDKYIVDVKTGGDDGEDNRQLGIYRLGYLHARGEDLPFGQFYYSKLDRYSLDIDLSVYTEEYILEEFRKLNQILEQKLLLANPSFDNCRFCGVSDACLEAKLK